MKLTILGATGSVGQELINQALSAGHTVTALVRNPDKLGELRSSVMVVQGDVTNPEAMKQAIASSDAVLNTLGHTKNSPDDVLTVATSNTITAMSDSNVKRLVVLTNTALSDVDDQPTTGQRFQRTMMGMMMGTINRDHENQAKLIANSELDWTIVRATMLGKGPRSSSYRVGKLDSNIGSSVARADVADFMLTCAANGKYVHAMPVISK